MIGAGRGNYRSPMLRQSPSPSSQTRRRLGFETERAKYEREEPTQKRRLLMDDDEEMDDVTDEQATTTTALQDTGTQTSNSEANYNRRGFQTTPNRGRFRYYKPPRFANKPPPSFPSPMKRQKFTAAPQTPSSVSSPMDFNFVDRFPSPSFSTHDNCCCYRPVGFIICLNCGREFKGRVLTCCPMHPKVLPLMDHRYCPHSDCASDKLSEIPCTPTPQSPSSSPEF